MLPPQRASALFPIQKGKYRRSDTLPVASNRKRALHIADARLFLRGPLEPNSRTMPPLSTQPALFVRDVSRNYGAFKALDSVSFEVARGERVALMGPSGSGKSTLLNCVGGIDRPDSGEIEINGIQLNDLNSDQLANLRRGQVSTVFQFFHLLPTLSAAENVEFPLQLNGVATVERAERVAELLEQVGLTNRANALPDELSGGEMQRVALARALATRPSLILADEPTGNLDSANGDAALDLIEALTERHGAALILVTHSDEATRICSRTLRLKDGRLQS
jgi:putative ABC transport system ATP-binding protein